MGRGVEITPPFFEVGPKAYLYGPPMVEFAIAADRASRDTGVQVIITPQAVDLASVARVVETVLVFAQHMDALVPGRGIGSTLPEAVKATGAVGSLLNHVERRLSRDDLEQTMRRAVVLGLATLVCADDAEDAASIAALRPTAIIVESPQLIAGGRRAEAERAAIAAANEAVWTVDPGIRVLHGAGIAGPQDVYEVIAAGAQGTGSTSAIFTAPDPAAMLRDMLDAVREAWDSTS